FEPNRPSGASPEPPVGFEPTTARLRIECSTPELRWRGANGAEGSRTPDLCSAIAALYQLSYGPGKSLSVLRYPLSVPATYYLNGRYKTRTCDLHDVNVAL